MSKKEVEITLSDMINNKKLGLNNFKIWERYDESIKQNTWVIIGHCADPRKAD